MIIPETITEANSRGEKLVFHKFKDDPKLQDYIILHSLFISKHIKRMSGEIDFLVIAPNEGIFCLEVKHGKVTRDHGIWSYENKLGRVTKSHVGPFRQASDSMHSLRNILSEKAAELGIKKHRINDLVFGWGVMFTSMTEFYEEGCEGESWQIYTRNAFRVPISEYVKSLSRGFHNKYSEKAWYDPNKSRPSRQDCLDILKLLRGDFSYDYKGINQIIDDELIIERFTEEQFRVLDFTDYNPRCLIQGGAGTGKTIMAKELFRKSVKPELKIGFFCFNSLLGQKLYDELSDLISNSGKNTFVGNLHSYLMKYATIKPPAEDPQVFYSTDLPIDFLISIEENEEFKKFDLIIIDEAQDLLTRSYIEVFDSILEGGISGGNWIFFGDFSNQAIFVSDGKKGIEILDSKSIFAKLPPLEINCRNTRKISLYNTVVTGSRNQISPSTMPEGDKVDQLFLPKAEIPAKVESIIKGISAIDPRLRSVTILSKNLIHNGVLRDSTYIRKKISSTDLEYHTISAFKGLENSIIVITDIDDFDSDYILNLLYVGISRARIKLYFICDADYESGYKKLLVSNIKKS